MQQESAEAQSFLFSDLALSRRLELAEAQSNVEFVETRARVSPASRAQWIEVAGAYAIYDGPHSPLTQSFGLGLFQAISHSELETIEEFYREFEVPVNHEVSPLADSSLLKLLDDRGYHPIEFTSVMFRPIGRDFHSTISYNEKIRVRLAQDNEQELWAQTAAKGWAELTEYAGVMLELMRITAGKRGALSFLAELDGRPIAAGAMTIFGGVALLSGASTIPEARKQGAQLALLDNRLRHAAEEGCDLAMMCALPGSASQRNAERQGFRIAYTRIKWNLKQQQVKTD
jgi:Acetyltransferase (GNAT) domain